MRPVPGPQEVASPHPILCIADQTLRAPSGKSRERTQAAQWPLADYISVNVPTEDRFGPPVETEYTRHLRERLKARRQRVAEAQARGELPGRIYDDEREDLTGLSVVEILNRGRMRVARAGLKER